VFDPASEFLDDLCMISLAMYLRILLTENYVDESDKNVPVRQLL